MERLPVGTATFVMTDVVGSTPIWEGDLSAAREAFLAHDAVMVGALESWSGHRPKDQGEGDSVFAVFESVGAALGFAVEVQRQLAEIDWPQDAVIRVRAALHTGEAELFGQNYKGSAVHRCARLRGLAHGGQTLLSESAALLVRDALPPGTSLADLGTHELRGLKEPERVFQLDVDGLERSFPALRSLSNPGVRHNLPQSASSFVGRERESSELLSLLHRQRLVTVVGPGGTGKTRLAVQVAGELVDGQGDGVWLVELAPLQDAGLVAPTVANALGVAGELGRSVSETLVDALRAKRLLLVLDNCEHLIDAAAELVDRLLRNCAHVAVLTTSREPLSISGEHVYRLAPLGVPPVEARSPLELLVSDAVALFVQRAVSQQASFTFDEANAVAVGAICRRLDGIPLAIELAAARVRALPPVEIERRLDERFRLLAGGSRTALPRQQTLRALVDWSYDLLDPRERLVLQQLSVLAGSFDLDAVEAIVTSDQVEAWELLDIVTALADKSLIENVDDPNEARWGLLETVREYARHRLEEDDGDVLDQLAVRHRDHFLGVAEAGDVGFRTGAQGAAQQRIETDYDNLRLAVATSFDDPNPEPSLRLGVALYLYWFRCRAVEGIDTLTQILDQPDAQTPTLQRGRALNALAGLLTFYGDKESARTRLDEASGAAEAHPDPRLLGEIQLNLASLVLRCGDPRGALPHLDEALRFADLAGDHHTATGALNLRSFVLYSLGDLQGAKTTGEELLRLTADSGDDWSRTAILNHLGLAEIMLGELGTAATHISEAIDRAERSGDQNMLATARGSLANIHILRGELDAARALYDASLDWARDQGALLLVGGALLGYALIATREQHPELAAQLHGAAASVFERAAHALDKEPVERTLQSEDHESLRQALGPSTFAQLYEQGSRLPLDEATELAGTSTGGRRLTGVSK